MQDIVDLFLELNELHWRGSAFQWFFYAGIALTLVFEKRRMLRIVFGWLPLLYLLCVFNPLSIRLQNLAGLHKPAYYARLFSFMPLMYVIARGFTLLLRIDNSWLKLATVGLACAVVCVAGKNIYLEEWLVKAENDDKVPRETLEILEAIDAEGNADVSVAPIGVSTVYIRQVANVVTPYGRKMSDLGNMLSQDPPDVQKAMELAGKQDVDYVVAHNTDATLSAFAGQGYAPHATTEGYAVFKVDNVPKLERTLNDRRQVTAATTCDASGAPVAGEAGYTTAVYTYDANGRLSGEAYLDGDGQPYSDLEGYHSIKRTYYFNGEVKTVSYLDRDGRPVMVGGRSKTAYAYNLNGQVVRETYYDTEDKRIGEVGEGLPVDDTCMKYIQRTSGARRDGNSVRFETKREGNRFSGAWFQIWDGLTGEYILTFGEGYGPSEINGEYVHELPSGLYKLAFKGNTNLADEIIYSLEYLTEGETLYYSYRLDDLQEKTVAVSDLYIGRVKPEER